MAGNKPIRKVSAAGLTGGGAALVVALSDILGAGMPEWLAALIVFVIGTGAGYITPSAPGEPVARRRTVPDPPL